jgi:acetylornithine deacetylase/succinyl-diaminopimelate desuccinylase-like protein
MLERALLLEAADRYAQAVQDFLCDLAAIPSVNGVDTELAVAERVQAEARRLGLACSLLSAENANPPRPNALVEWGDGPRGFGLIAHMDTVAAGDEAAWSSPPFTPDLRDGNIFGRGTADNKAGLALAVYTLALLRDQGWLDPGACRLVAAGVVDEESGASSSLGVRFLLDEGHLPIQAAIYTYASDVVCTGHRGLLRLRLTAHGKAIHSGSPAWSRGEGGVNASTGLARALLELEGLFDGYPRHPAFPGMFSTITPGTLLSGGEFESIVPARAEAVLDARLLPGLTGDAVLASIVAILRRVEAARPGLRFELEVKNNLPAALVEAGHPLVRIAQDYTEVITGRRWAAEGAGPANEGYMLIQKGIPTLCGFGPSGGGAHAVDEWVQLDSLTPTLAMYAGIIVEYLGGKGQT